MKAQLSLRLAAPVVSASIAAIVLTGFISVMLTSRIGMDPLHRFNAIWPLTLASTCAIILVMSLLYRTILDFVEDLKASEKQARHLATHDPLSGLGNRALFSERLEQALAAAKGTSEHIAVVSIDLDRFKQVNDKLGHASGDELICRVAEKLKALVRDTDTVVRLGGDEFAIIMPGSGDMAKVEALGHRIRTAINTPFKLSNGEAHIGVSIGVAMAPKNGLSVADLLQKSDIALYTSKAEGECNPVLFSEDMKSLFHRHADIENHIRAALSGGGSLKILYQPQVSCSTREIVGFEALLRLEDAHLRDISPIDILEVAAERGLSVELGEWIFGQVCQTARRWPDLSITVNVSEHELASDIFARKIIEILDQNGVSPRQIDLEVKECESLESNLQMNAAIEQLRDAGFKIVLDDFGGGFSSLAYLMKLHADKVKIDARFVNQMIKSENAVAVFRSLVGLGHALGLKVAAEGVETAEQNAIAHAAGCDELQGYLYSKPVPAASIAEVLQQSECWQEGDTGIFALI